MSPTKSVTASEDTNIASKKTPTGALEAPATEEIPLVSVETLPVTVISFSRTSIARVTIAIFLNR